MQYQTPPRDDPGYEWRQAQHHARRNGWEEADALSILKPFCVLRHRDKPVGDDSSEGPHDKSREHRNHELPNKPRELAPTSATPARDADAQPDRQQDHRQPPKSGELRILGCLSFVNSERAVGYDGHYRGPQPRPRRPTDYTANKPNEKQAGASVDRGARPGVELLS